MNHPFLRYDEQIFIYSIKMASAFIYVDKPFYFAGDTVQGAIYLNLYDNLSANQVFIKFKGWESVRWFEERLVNQSERQNMVDNQIFNVMFKVRMESSDSEDNPGQDDSFKLRYVQDGPVLKEITKYTGEKSIARFQQVLFNFGGSFIPAGQYSFPFSFKTGQNYPASYMDKNIKDNRRGRIKYELQAFVRGFNSHLFLVRTKQEVVIRETTPIKNDHQQMQAHVKSCCCIDQGITRIQCFFQKNAYTPGQEARIYCKVDNTEGKSQVDSVDVSLVNRITYTSSEAHKKTFEQIIFKKKFPGLGIGQQGQRQQTALILNAQLGSSAVDIKPTSTGSRLHSVYFLKVEASLSAFCTCCSDLPIVEQPVLIYPFIPVDYNFKSPPKWAPKIMPMTNFQVGIGNLGVSGGINMQIGGGMNVQMNVPAPPAVNMKINKPAPPHVQMKVIAPEPILHGHVHGHVHGHAHGHVGAHVGGGISVNASVSPHGMNVNSPGLKMNVNTGVGMHVNSSGMGMNMNIRM